MVQAVIAHAEDLLCCPQPQPTKNRSVPRGSCSCGLASMPWWSGKIKPASWDGWDRIWITNGSSTTDIAVPPPYAPMDFAAWIEVYLSGRWYTFDPRNNAQRIGRVLIAHGRDAADVPLTHIFGPGTLSGFRVSAEEAPVE